MRGTNRWTGVLLLGLGALACRDAAETVQPTTRAVPQGVGHQQAARWFEIVTPEAMAVPGAVYADLREDDNQLVFGVEHAAAAAAVRGVTRRFGIPDDAVTVVQTAPIIQMATLRDRWRPTQGGIQIHFGQFLCTMGFNADDGTERSFITNSHCTNKQGGVEGTQYYQPLSSVDGTVIATEVEDPQYFRGGVCPRGRKCRYSDASRARYSDGVSSSRGVIAKTSGPNNGGIEVTGSFTVTSQDNTSTSFSGTVNKVGRTTGWTQGSVVGTCVTVNVSGTNITQLCQTLVQDPNGAVVIGGGDSGSNVFKITSGDNVQLIGIAWGGSSDGRLFVFSPLKQIRDELGAITATN